MDRPQKLILCSLVAVAAAGWLTSQALEQDMMYAMGRTDVLSIPVFVSIWTVGMAAMMFPAIVPMVALYNRLANSGGRAQVSVEAPRTYSAKVVLFVGCYLVVWSLAGIALLLGWSQMMGLVGGSVGPSMHYVVGAVLIIAGTYQFTPLKTKCLGYCESPMSFFMRRWKSGTAGAVRMGLYHGLYCLGCCWPYFLLMVALGWMNLFWMALFAAIIFGEKIWSRGIWVARAAGAGFVIAGILVVAGTLQTVPAMEDMSMESMEPAEPMGPTESMEPMESTETVAGDSMDAMAP